ncbi:MFS transporter [Streptomyces sp. NPDC018693]|uniref:MFS transporter n=1 Tax=unclassified Streptomyces TaxID=2593676 RepID=UPI0037B7E557
MPPSPTPILTVTADTLVAADFTPRIPSRTPGPYRRLLATPGARAFTAAGLLARLPMGMLGISAILMVADARGSYALAGALTATGLAATALVAPWIARLIDRHGQARIALPATLLATLSSVALLLCLRHNAPTWTLFAAYAATATIPNIGGLSRARWVHLLKDDKDDKDNTSGKSDKNSKSGKEDPRSLHTANSFEQSVDELCFMLGPVLAAFLCEALFPEAGVLVALSLLVTGVALFTAQRSTEPPSQPLPPASRSRNTPLRAVGMRPLLAVCLAMGAVFGATEVVTIAFADERGHRAAAGLILALQAAGSCAAGLLYGAVSRAGSAERRYPWCIAAMAALLTLPLLAAALTGSLTVLAGAVLIAGMATAPTMITNMALIQRRTPEGRLNEGMTLAVTGLLGGIAGGSAAGGWMVEHVSATAGYGVPLAAATIALLASLMATRPLAAPGQSPCAISRTTH